MDANIVLGILNLIGVIANATMAFYIKGRRLPAQNELDQAKGDLSAAQAIETLQETVGKQAQEDQRLSNQVNDLQRRLAEVEHKRVGPFLLNVEFLTSPQPVVTKAELLLLPDTQLNGGTKQ